MTVTREEEVFKLELLPLVGVRAIALGLTSGANQDADSFVATVPAAGNRKTSGVAQGAPATCKVCGAGVASVTSCLPAGFHCKSFW